MPDGENGRPGGLETQGLLLDFRKLRKLRSKIAAKSPQFLQGFRLILLEIHRHVSALRFESGRLCKRA